MSEPASDAARDDGARIRASETMFRGLVENIPNCVVATLDRELQITFIGGKGLDPIGLRSEDLIGQRLAGILSPAQLAIAEPQMRAAFRGDVITFELAYRPDAIFSCTAAPLRHADGHIEAVIVNSINITTRRHAEHRIHRLNRTYAVMSGINETIVRERDPQLIIERACRIAIDAGGFLGAWIGLNEPHAPALTIRASAGMDAATLALVSSYLQATESCHFTLTAVRSGAPTTCNDIATDPAAEPWRAAALARGYRSMISLPLRKSASVVGAFNLYADERDFFDREELRLLGDLAADISFALQVCASEHERQHAAEKLRANEERFRLLIENVSDVITVIDNQGVIQFQSPSVVKILGYEPDEMVGRSAFAFLHPDDIPATAAAVERCIRQPETPIPAEYRLRNKAGQWRYLHSIGRSAPGLAEGGFIVVTSRDMTEQRLLEEQLRQSQKMDAIGQLAGGIAHDFNNILAAMLMQSELIADLPGASPEMLKGLREIRKSGERAANLTRQLIVFSRRQVMQPRDINLNEVVSSLAKMLQRLIGEDVRLQLHPSPLPLVARADPGMIDQILLNFAVNARDAMPAGGVLTIETCRRTLENTLIGPHGEASPGPYVGLSVADTGTGIDPEILPRIFEPFFTTKEPGKGTGLGLATVFGIVKQHNGWVEVQSEPGRGSCFRVFVPAGASAPSARETSEAPAPRGTEGILLVEDEPSVRALSRALLKRHGYVVFEASDGVEALRVWGERAAEISLLFTDMVMPSGLSGQDLAVRLQQARPGLKVLFASGYSAEIVGQEANFRVGENFLQKPFSQNQLLWAVRRCLHAA